MRLYLVRHGRATAGWDVDPDPGLDGLGQHQAAALRDRLAPLGPLPIVTSPLRRCRETALPLAATWDITPVVDAAVAEIPSPEGVPMGERVEWLRTAMRGTWTDLGERYLRYRDGVVSALRSFADDSAAPGDRHGIVVFSHFVAINAAVGIAAGDDRVFIHRLDNCSVTVVDVDGDDLRLVERGHEADTQIR